MVEKSCIAGDEEAESAILSDSGFVEHNVDGFPQTIHEPRGNDTFLGANKSLEACSIRIGELGPIVFVSVVLKDTVFDDGSKASDITTYHQKAKIGSFLLVEPENLIENVIEDSTVTCLEV